MLDANTPRAQDASLSSHPSGGQRRAWRGVGAQRDATSESRRVADRLALLAARLQPQRRVLRAGHKLYRAGDRFANLHVLNSGMVKLVGFAGDGREQVFDLRFRGDWLGCEGIACSHFACDAVVLDTSEVWSFGYAQFLHVGEHAPALMSLLHEAMSRQLASSLSSLLTVCTLTADARVAAFLCFLAEAAADRGLRSDHIQLRMTRQEIGNFLNLTLESVSRALSKLARRNIIAFPEKTRRDVIAPDVEALSTFVRESASTY